MGKILSFFSENPEATQAIAKSVPAIMGMFQASSAKSAMEGYQTKLDNNNPFYVCKRSCGKTVNKRSQWKQEIQLR